MSTSVQDTLLCSSNVCLFSLLLFFRSRSKVSTITLFCFEFVSWQASPRVTHTQPTPPRNTSVKYFPSYGCENQSRQSLSFVCVCISVRTKSERGTILRCLSSVSYEIWTCHQLQSNGRVSRGLCSWFLNVVLRSFVLWCLHVVFVENMKRVLVTRFLPLGIKSWNCLKGKCVNLIESLPVYDRVPKRIQPVRPRGEGSRAEQGAGDCDESARLQPSATTRTATAQRSLPYVQFMRLAFVPSQSLTLHAIAQGVWTSENYSPRDKNEKQNVFSPCNFVSGYSTGIICSQVVGRTSVLMISVKWYSTVTTTRANTATPKRRLETPSRYVFSTCLCILQWWRISPWSVCSLKREFWCINFFGVFLFRCSTVKAAATSLLWSWNTSWRHWERSWPTRNPIFSFKKRPSMLMACAA